MSFSGTKQSEHYKTAVKVQLLYHTERKPQRECMFQNRFQKNDFEPRPCAKYSGFVAHFSLLVGFYSGFQKAIQKLSFAAVLQHFAQAGKRQKADDFEFQRGVIVLFERARTKSTIKPQRKDTFGGGVQQGPNESTKTVVLRTEHCKTAARSRVPWSPGLNRSEKLTFCKKRAKPQREAKEQRATDRTISQREGWSRGEASGKGVSGRRSRGEVVGKRISGRRSRGEVLGRGLGARSRGEVSGTRSRERSREKPRHSPDQGQF